MCSVILPNGWQNVGFVYHCPYVTLVQQRFLSLEIRDKHWMSGIILDIYTESRPVEAHSGEFLSICCGTLHQRIFKQCWLKEEKKISLYFNALVLLVTSVWRAATQSAITRLGGNITVLCTKWVKLDSIEKILCPEGTALFMYEIWVKPECTVGSMQNLN